MRNQVSTYVELANDLEPKDAASAGRIRELVAELVEELVATERNALKRRFDPATILVTPLFLLPAVIAVFLIWPLDSLWKWLVALVAAFWALVVFVAAWQTSWKEKEKPRSAS